MSDLAGTDRALIGMRKFKGLREELDQVEVPSDSIPDELKDVGLDTVHAVIDVLISERTARQLQRALAQALPGWVRPFAAIALRSVFPERARLVLKELAGRLFR